MLIKNHTKRPLLLAGLAFPAAASLTGCANDFDRHYRGEVASPVKHTEIVLSPPEDSRLLGESKFVSHLQLSKNDVAQAAKRIGADSVTWDVTFQGSTSETAMVPVTKTTDVSAQYSGRSSGRYSTYGDMNMYGNSYGNAYGQGSATATTTTYVPTVVTKNWYEHLARFYRSRDADRAAQLAESQR